jgi:hypothetical protein
MVTPFHRLRIPRREQARALHFRRCAGFITAIIATALAVPATADAPSRLTPEFTLRLRQIHLDAADSPTRSETRLHAQVRLDAEVAKRLHVIVALGTTREGDPVSAEATLGDRFGDLPIAFRTAAISWRPENAPDLTLLAGKLEPPFLAVSDLVWDPDVRPEGAAARWARTAGAFDFIAMAGAFVLRDDDEFDGAERAHLYALQVAARHRWPDRSWAIVGAGFYPSDDPSSDAMAEGGAPLPAAQYRPVEFFAAATWELYFPIRGLIHGVINPEADRAREGWLAGLTVGRTRAIHGMELGWEWRRIESDAVLAAFTDNELWPGTGRTEHRFRLAYRPTAGLRLGLVWSEGRRLDGRKPDSLRAVALEALAEF